MNIQHLKEALTICMQNNLVPLITSKPGVGKSDVVRQVAQDKHLELIDVRLGQVDPTELNGFPYIEEGIAKYIPMNIFPLEDTPIPQGKEGFLLFFDELRNADIQTQAAAYKIILDRQIGKHKLHPKCFIVCAGNREEDNCFVTPMPSALRSRMLHIQLEEDADLFQQYMQQNSFDHRIISFLGYKKEHLYTNHTNNAEDNYACPRTWEFANRILKDQPLTPLIRELLGGCLGHGIAIELEAYCKYFKQLPTYKECVSNTAKLANDDLGLIWACIGMITSETKEKDCKHILAFIEANMPIEYQMTCIKGLVDRYPSMLTLAEMQPWLKKLAEVMYK